MNAESDDVAKTGVPPNCFTSSLCYAIDNFRGSELQNSIGNPRKKKEQMGAEGYPQETWVAERRSLLKAVSY